MKEMQEKKAPYLSNQAASVISAAESHNEALLDELLAAMEFEIFSENGLHGLKDKNGKILLPPHFDNIKTFSFVREGDLIACKLNGLWGIVRADGSGNWLHNPFFDYIGYIGEFAPVRKNDKWGVLQVLSSSYLLPLECDGIQLNGGHMFTNGVAVYEKDGKLGVIMDNGRFTAPLFDDVEAEHESWVKVNKDGVWGYIDALNQFTTNEDDASFNCFFNE